MKVTPNKILKTSSSKIRFHQEKELLQQCGTNLCIRSILDTKSLQPEFITIGQSTPSIPQPLKDQNNKSQTAIKLYDFIPSNNRKNIYTVECIQNNVNENKSIEVCCYHILQLDSQSGAIGHNKVERKSIKLSQVSGYVPYENICDIYLVPEYFNSGLLYVVTKTLDMECYCITLVEMQKTKVLGIGFVPIFEHATVSQFQDGQLSIIGKNFLKKIKIQQKQQCFSVCDEKLSKKFIIGGTFDIFKHHWLGFNKLLLATKKNIYVTQGQTNTPYEIVSTINVIGQQQDNQIKQIIVISKSILVFLKNLDILVYSEDGQDSPHKYQLAETTSLTKYFDTSKNIQKYPNIIEIIITKNFEELMISLDNGEYWYSRYEQLELGSEQNHFSFQKIPITFYAPLNGDLYPATGQNFSLISSQKMIQIWDLQKLSLVNRIEFQIPGTNKSISKCALNPDGHSICVAFQDRIRFYRILINKFKQFAQIYISKCSYVQYSHGGQMVACASGRGSGSMVTVIDTMKLKQIICFKLQYTPNQIVWNEHDDTIYVSTLKKNLIHTYYIPTKSKNECICLASPAQLIRFDYASKGLIVSLSTGGTLLVKNNQQMELINSNIKGLYNLFPSDGIYFASTKYGKLYYSSNISFEKKYQLSLFDKEFRLQYRRGCLLAYTDVSNVLLLKVKLPQNNQMVKKQDQNIMLVQKQQILHLFDRTKYLESQLQQLQNITTVKLDQQRKKYNESIAEISKKFQQQTNQIKKQNVQLQNDYTKNNKHSERMFDELENGQIRSVNELQKVYDLKIKLQKQKYLALQQQNMQQKMRYQSMINKIEKNYHEDIQKVRKQYSMKLEQKNRQVECQKSKTLTFKKKLQTKLVDLQEQNQLTLFQLQNKKDGNIKNLIQKNTKLQRQYDSLMIQLHNTREQLQEIKQQNERNIQKLKRNERSVSENSNRVQVLQQQLRKRNKMIQQKNITIQQNLHQIQQLQKSKYVLTFRTFQIRKTLQPKQQLIQKLKSNLLKLQQESKEQKKVKFQIQKSAQKYYKLLQSLKKQNQQLKLVHKHITTVHNNLCADIYIVMNNIDIKQRNNHFVQIYQKYVKQELVKNQANSSFKNDPTSQQINRHLIHVQQSLQQVAQGNEKMLEGKKKEVDKKMKQNAQLLYELNVMRKKLRQFEKKLQEKEIQISKLKRENKEVREIHKSTRANTAQTGFTRRMPSRDPASIKQTNQLIDLSIRRQSDYLIPDRKGARSRVVSAHKTMMWREDSRKQKSRMPDLAKQLEQAKTIIRKKQKMIQELNHSLLELAGRQMQ